MFWQKKRKLYAPVDGVFVALQDVADEVFSSGMMGQGMAIEPTADTIVAPADVKVISASDTMKHALGLRLSNGCELLIHVGIDTVLLKNQGFVPLVEEGAKVKRGTPLLKFDPQLIKQNGLKQTVMMIVTEAKDQPIEWLPNLQELTGGKTAVSLLK
ncbi:PTS glucose transporter subunit IIA [Enterococcus pseudoavium]|uniref:PTS glucose transporter subunit IIA n=2 Tax=Enterococcus pseudoavium TaxID=44007 RepID=A0ABU3FEB7_9ENTE|nr:PTS glucose transporter subunit IIA [Enterococcus pseudoavium]MDT2754561.1 PTS glucose transporter subunit IIA [Enterococcus pseudoavium]MDT2769383.1 PTS glucose transporter subunit IIA [Enterococcus pseudoavium]REC31128.1 PTS sugar transporter subunit IIA [Enterococcus pseudoavium]